MSLRDCLRYWRPESLTLAMPPQPVKLSALCQMLAQSVVTVQRVAPSPLSLQELYDSIRDCYLQGRPETLLHKFDNKISFAEASITARVLFTKNPTGIRNFADTCFFIYPELPSNY